MKTGKRIIALVLMLVMLAGMLPVTAMAGQTAGGRFKNLKWTLSSSGVLTISGKGRMPEPKNEEDSYDFFPWDEYEIRRRVKQIVIENGVTSVSKGAFFDLYPSSISFPASMRKLGENCLPHNDTRTITVDKANPSFSALNGVLYNKTKTVLIYCAPGKPESTFRVPDSVTTLGISAMSPFYNCVNIKKYYFPKGLTTITRNNYSESAFCWGEGMYFYAMHASVYFAGNAPSGVLGCVGTVYYPKGNKTYTKKVRDRLVGGETWEEVSWKTWSPDSVDPNLLDAPGIIKIENVKGGIQFQWAKVSGAAKYRAFYRTKKGSWTAIGDTTGTSMKLKGVKSGTKYYLSVRCVSKDGKRYTSDFDQQGTIAIYTVPPTQLRVKNTRPGTATLTWKKVPNMDGYQIQYSTDKTFKTGVNTEEVSNNESTATVENLKKNKTYYFRICSFKTEEEEADYQHFYSAFGEVKSVKITK